MKVTESTGTTVKKGREEGVKVDEEVHRTLDEETNGKYPTR